MDQLATLLEKRLGGANFAMLVVPDHWGLHPLSEAKAFQARLRAWSDAGIEMFVHGWFHKDTAEHSGVAAFKAQHMTAGEGEFLGLSEEVALDRMVRGKALIEDAIGRPVAGFIAPAWLYGEGAMAALRRGGFTLAEDHWRVWNAATGITLTSGPVVTWASRSAMRTASSLTFAALARVVLPLMPTVRVAVHPGDVSKSSLLSSIDATLRRFAATHRPARYRELLNDDRA